MKDLVVVKLPYDANDEEMRELLSSHEYGSDFIGCLNLESPDECLNKVDLDEWLPLDVETIGYQVLVSYRLCFIDKKTKGLVCFDCRVSGSRDPDRLVFQRHAVMPDHSRGTQINRFAIDAAALLRHWRSSK
jgi:hypothetical protein